MKKVDMKIIDTQIIEMSITFLPVFLNFLSFRRKYPATKPVGIGLNTAAT
jgi:hypothetical protein